MRTYRSQFSWRDLDPGELAFVGGDEGVAEGLRVRGDQQIVSADRLSGLLETGAKLAVDGVGRGLERQDLEGAENRLDLRAKARRSLLCRTVAKLGRDDDARADLGLTHLPDTFCHTAVRVADRSATMFVSSR